MTVAITPHDRNRLQTVFEAAATLLAFVSIGMFGWGAYTAREGFTTTTSASLAKVVPAYTCDTAVAFIRAQADAGQSSAHNPGTGGEAVKVRGGWVVLPACK